MPCYGKPTPKGIEFVILEKKDNPGGLCRSIEYDGHNLDVGDRHFLCSKYKEVDDFILKIFMALCES